MWQCCGVDSATQTISSPPAEVRVFRDERWWDDRTFDAAPTPLSSAGEITRQWFRALDWRMKADAIAEATNVVQA